MRTFVTGGAGFIGSHTVARLLEAGHEVQVWDDLSTGKRENIDFAMGKIAFLQGDIRDFTSLDSTLSQWRPDAILHLAAIPSVPRSVEEPRVTHAVNLTGTLNVLEIARRQEIPRVVLACSAAIFGNEPEVPKRETSPASPSSPYGLEKWQSEQYAALYSELFGLATISLRYFNVFGPRQDPKSPYSGVISIFLDRVLSSRQVIIDGTGEQTRDFIFVADVAEANLLALTSAESGHQRFNIGRGEETSVLQLFDLICQVVGGKPEPAFGPPRPGDVYRSCADAAQAAAALGFSPRYTVREGLERLVEWYKSASA